MEVKEVLDEEGALEVDGTAIQNIERANIDVQIATAHQWPRDLTTFKERSLAIVSMDEETAQSCIYRRPVGKKNGKPVYAEGKSVRLAEIVGGCYGNLRVGAMLIEMTDRHVKARGMAHDLESNFAATSEVIESTVDKNGNPYSDRMRVVVAKAALAKARRDATFQVVPGALCKSIEETARKVAIGDEKTLNSRKKTVSDWINKLGIEEERVWKSLGITGIDDMTLKHLETLTGLRTAIKDGDITVDEAFPVDASNFQTEKLDKKLKLDEITDEEMTELTKLITKSKLNRADIAKKFNLVSIIRTSLDRELYDKIHDYLVNESLDS